jgi:hypothetical protein
VVSARFRIGVRRIIAHPCHGCPQLIHRFRRVPDTSRAHTSPLPPGSDPPLPAATARWCACHQRVADARESNSATARQKLPHTELKRLTACSSSESTRRKQLLSEDQSEQPAGFRSVQYSLKIQRRDGVGTGRATQIPRPRADGDGRRARAEGSSAVGRRAPCSERALRVLRLGPPATR